MRVLFISKPIVPPFHDGTRCFVRDLSVHLTAATPTIFTTPGTSPPASHVLTEPIYAAPGAFAPAIVDNARVLRRLLLGASHDLWHFVFAPNPLSSAAARLAVTLRRIPTVQTVASIPRSFEGSSRLLFGHHIVCQSRSTWNQLIAAGAPAARLSVILPPLTFPDAISERDRTAALQHLDLPSDGSPLLVYPGDLEFSGGAHAVALAAPEILKRIPEATIVFACRPKTPRAHTIEQQLRTRLAPLEKHIVFAGQVPSLPALLSASKAVLFPVDDLYGKVDLPLSLLEAQALGVPVIALQQGPLLELEGAIPLASSSSLAQVCCDLLRDESLWNHHRDAGRNAVRTRHDPAKIAAQYEEIYRKITKDR